MRILWITNIMLPPLCKALDLKVSAFGGWMYSSLKRLKQNSTSNKYAVATVWQGKELKKIEIGETIYYILPLKGRPMTDYNSSLEVFWKNIKNEFNPDVVHIHGSEYPHGLSYVNACGAEGVVVSIQGLVSCYARYYTGGITLLEIRNNVTFRDIVKGGILKGQRDFYKRGKHEIELLHNVKHIIGRTEWDKSHSWAINQEAQYHPVGETLRDIFYCNKWNYSNCEPNSIFVSQASYPVKGLHKLLEALPLVLNEYPNTKVYVAGTNECAKPWYRITGYGRYLKNLIKKYSLQGKIVFTGILDEEQMCKRYLSSNLFVCCSAIENSPNSLGEAQILGMPYISSFVGGVPEIVDNNPEVLYRFEETEMLAKKICDIFKLKDNVRTVENLTNRYDAQNNMIALMKCYEEIMRS